MWGEYFPKAGTSFHPGFWHRLDGWLRASHLIFFGSQFLYLYNDRVVVLWWPLRTSPSLKLPLLHSGNLSNPHLHIFYNRPLKLCMVYRSHVSSSEGSGTSGMVWMPSACREHCGVFCTPPAKLMLSWMGEITLQASVFLLSIQWALNVDYIQITLEFLIYLKKCLLSILELSIFFPLELICLFPADTIFSQFVETNFWCHCTFAQGIYLF